MSIYGKPSTMQSALPILISAKETKLSDDLDLRLDGIRNEALGLGSFHDFTGTLELRFRLDGYMGSNRHLGDAKLAFDVFQ
jgi:hypothetical protein